jgi:hypothetical protein
MNINMEVKDTSSLHLYKKDVLLINAPYINLKYSLFYHDLEKMEQQSQPLLSILMIDHWQLMFSFWEGLDMTQLEELLISLELTMIPEIHSFS